MRVLRVNRLQIAMIAVLGFVLVLFFWSGTAFAAVYTISDDAAGGDCDLIGFWDSASKTCTLTSDLNLPEILPGAGIDLVGSGISLNGDGYVITGQSSGTGISIIGASDAMVTNIKVRQFDTGILVENSTKSNIYNTDISQSVVAVSIYDSEDISVSENDFDLNHDTFDVFTSIDIEFSSNNVDRTEDDAVGIFDTTNIRFFNNNIYRTADNGIGIFNSSNISLTNNTVDSSGDAGIGIFDSTSTIFSRNRVSNSADEGVGFFDSSGNIIKNNTFESNGWSGLYIYNSDHLIWSNNFIDNKIGIDASSGMNNMVARNYWSDYDSPEEGCSDMDSNGICDSPYIFVMGQDDLPRTSMAFDSDGDGLDDNWELYGIDSNGDGDVYDDEDINLPALGADPLHKDVFVEIDYLENVGDLFPSQLPHTHRPQPGAIEAVIDAYKKSPVQNPDGSTGINLHVDISDAIRETAENIEFGYASDASTSGSIYYDWGPYYDIRANPKYFQSARNGIFHYALFVHDFEGTKWGGVGSKPGDKFIVCNSPTRLFTSLAFMHELGHNLGLGHGGQDYINYKPNYLSIMNYSFSRGGLWRDGLNGVLDYSHFASPREMPILDEYLLDETVGLSGGPSNYDTFYWHMSVPDVIQPIYQPFAVNVGGPVNWNLVNGYESNIQLSINRDELYDQLISFDDWYFLQEGGVFISGTSSTSPTMSFPSHEEINALSADYLVDVNAAADEYISPGDTAISSFTLTNQGTQDDEYSISAISEHGWISQAPVAHISLAAGESSQIIVEAKAPPAITEETIDELSVTAQSQNNSNISDSATTHTIACGEPMLALSNTPAYWSSLADYRKRNLSVDFKITRPSKIGDVSIDHITSNHGVFVNTGLPLTPEGEIVGEWDFTVEYTVPAIADSFETTIFASTRDACGNTYEYPRPWPGV